MLKKVSFLISFFIFSSFYSYVEGSSGAIEIAVSPIKFDIVMNPGESTTQTVKFYNKDTTTSTFTLSAADCVAGVDYGTPKCTPSASVLDPIHASGWIAFEGPTTLTIPPNSEKLVQFTIRAPSNAVPGGHYGAIFFNNPMGGPVANSITTAYRIGPLFLIKINGDIIYNTSLGDISVSGIMTGPGGGSAGANAIGLTSALKDLFQSAPDFNSVNWNQVGSVLQDEFNPFWDKPDLPKDAFLFRFDIPLTNSGNTHIKPVGRIELFDDDGNPLKGIGRESIKRADGLYLGEKVVDYLPINDEESNVLPNTERVYPVEWKGFGYMGIEDGKEVVKFKTPSAYYSEEVEDGNQFLWPWERIRLVRNNKHLRAQISIEYSGENGKLMPLDTQKEIEIEYLAINKTLNYGVIVPFVILAILAFYIIRRKGNRIDELEEEMDVYEDEVDEFQHARDMAKKALEKKELRRKNADPNSVVSKRQRKKKENIASLDEDVKQEKETKISKDNISSSEEDIIIPAVKKRVPRKTIKPE